MSVADCRNGAEFNPLRDSMEIWAFVDPENVHEKLKCAVCGDDGGWDLNGLAVGDTFVLLLCSLPL